jgi:uncharacterized membrane protein
VETKKSKYDTNPLDPDVERKAEESWGAGGGETQQVSGSTRQVGDAPPSWIPTPDESARRNVYSEAPTRRYDNPSLEAPYPSVFIAPTYAPPAQYPPHERQPVYANPPVHSYPNRQVPGIGIPEKWALMMAYAPYIGIVVSLLELFLVPRKDVKIRSHAAQALSLHIAFIVIASIFTAIRTVTGSDLGGVLFSLASTIFLVISMIRVAKGQPHRIAPLDEPAKWFNQHIEPRNQG